jgi:hypothetical protein
MPLTFGVESQGISQLTIWAEEDHSQNEKQGSVPLPKGQGTSLGTSYKDPPVTRAAWETGLCHGEMGN